MDWFWPNRRNRSQSPQASSAGIKTTTLVKQAKISYGFIMIKHCSTKCTGKNSLLCSARCCTTNERRSFLIVVSESAAFTQNSSSQSPQFVLFPPALSPLLFHEQDFRPTPTCSIKVVVSVRVSKPNISESLSQLSVVFQLPHGMIRSGSFSYPYQLPHVTSSTLPLRFDFGSIAFVLAGLQREAFRFGCFPRDY